VLFRWSEISSYEQFNFTLEGNVRTNTGRDEDENFAPNHLLLQMLGIKEVTEWANNAAKGAAGTRLHFFSLTYSQTLNKAGLVNTKFLVCAGPIRDKGEAIMIFFG
jgi:hypothetical protein